MPPWETDLGTAELEVLKALWDLGPSTVRETLNHLHEQGRKIAYTTVLTMLTRLEQKGFVRSDKSGVAYVYRAKVSRERITRSRLRSLLTELFDGAAAPLVLQLVREEQLSPEEIAELRHLIAELDEETESKVKGRRKKR